MLNKLKSLFTRKAAPRQPTESNQIFPVNASVICYELELGTAEIKPATMFYYGKVHFALFRKDCIYESALNKRNAERKLIARMKEIIKQNKQKT